MKIFITGEERRADELSKRLGEGHQIDWVPMEADLDEEELDSYDVIFDLNLDEQPDNMLFYAGLEGKPVFGSAVKTQLAETVYYLDDPIECTLIGINAMPGFIDRSLAELSLYNAEDRPQLDEVMAKLGWDFKVVADRVGMVTPRIVCMIINEAFYTLQEGTASEADIDESMKLGVNYPYGPFEWAASIGIGEVFETLEAIYSDTHDERYKICPLLKTRYLREGRE